MPSAAEVFSASGAGGARLPERGGALQDLVIVEITGTLAGEFTGGLLADQGATVIKIEPPTGSPMRRRGAALTGEDSLYFQSENRGKYSVEAEIDTIAAEPWLTKLLAHADGVIEDLGPGRLEAAGLDPARLLQRNPALAVLRISPFGQDGPLALERGDDRIAQAFGGSQYVTGFADRHPLPISVPLADTWTGLAGAAGLLMAIFHARRHGTGQVVDIALYEAILRMQEGYIVRYDRLGQIQERFGNINPGVSPSGVFPTRDGSFIALSGAGDQPFQRLCEAIGMPEIYEDPRFSTGPERLKHREEANAIVGGWIAQHDLAEVDARFIAASATGAPLKSADELLVDEHFNARGAFLELISQGGHRFQAPGPQPRMTRTPAREPERAPRLGEHTDQFRLLAESLPEVPPRPAARDGAPDMPLGELRVIDISRALAGPAAATQLADFGADVVLVELPLREPPKSRFEGERPMLGFLVTNRNKRSVTLDVRSAEGRLAFLDLIRSADVLVENFRPGTLERWGIGPDDLLAVNQRLVILRASGFGQTGPFAGRSAFNPVGLAYGGLMYLGGWPDRPPLRDGVQAGDYSTALFGFYGTVAALLRRELDGEGQVVDTAMCEAILRQTGDVAALKSALATRSERNAGVWPTYPVTATSLATDGTYVAISGESWERTLEALSGVLGTRPTSPQQATELLDAFVAQRTASEAVTALRAAGVPSSEVNSAATIHGNEHIWSRGTLVHVEHPELGDIVTQGVVPKLSRTPGRVRFWSPYPGSDNEAVLGGLLGYDAERVEQLTQAVETAAAD